VVLPYAFNSVHAHDDLLARAHLDEQNVRVTRLDFSTFGEHVVLFAERHPNQVFRVDVVVDIQLVRIRLAGHRALQTAVLPCALDIQAQDDGVVVAGRAAALVILGRLLVPFQPAQAVVRALEGDKTQAVGEDLVLDDGGVVVDEDVFDGEGGDLGEKDAAESVCDGGVEAGEGEGGVVWRVGVEGDVEVLGWKSVFEGDLVGVCIHL
jgi:hypothetical protein